MFNVRKKLVACLVLVAFMFCLASPVYANTEEYTGAVIESGHYTENGMEYEYVISIKENADILTTIYTMDEGNRVLYDQFITSRIGNIIYIDGQPAAYIDESLERLNNERPLVQSANVSVAYEPTVEYYADNITALSNFFVKGVWGVASVLASALVEVSQVTIVPSMLLEVASEIIADSIDVVHFEQYVIEQLFPEDNPAVSLRRTNRVGFYTSVYLTNMIGDWVESVYEYGLV